MLASFDYLQNEYNHDLKDLKNALQEAHDWNSNEEIPFIEMAIVNVEVLSIIMCKFWFAICYINCHIYN